MPMTAWDLALWEAEDRIAPWGPERGDMQAGIVARAVSVFGYRQPRRTLRPDEYILEFGASEESKKRQRAAVTEDVRRALKHWGGNRR